MTIGLRVGQITDELGSSEFVHAFFSTISGNCEESWGAAYPHLMKELYQGRLNAENAGVALTELQDALEKLNQLPVSNLIWDINNKEATPPWGDQIAPSITSLGDYFVTSVGRDMFTVLAEALEDATSNGKDAYIE